MSSTSQASSGGIGLGGAVFVVFLVLKLTGHIDWSWWWVTCPLWAPVGLVLGIVGIALVFAAIAAVFKAPAALVRRAKRR